MKPKKQIVIAGILLCLFCGKITAQAPYRVSAGGMPLGIGPSFKFFLKDKVAFQSDILLRETITGGYIDNELYPAFHATLETNSSLMRQKKLKDKKSSELFGLIGGGISLGYAIESGGKFGVNAIFGLEYVFRNGITSIQIDLRPGYSVLLNYGGEINLPWNSFKSPWSHFDWMFGITFRRIHKDNPSQPE